MTGNATPTILDGEEAVAAAAGHDLGVTEWLEVTQQRIDEFARATGDPRATCLALSLSNLFLPQIVEVRGFALGVNYGTQAVRFGSPLIAGDRVRGRATLVDVAAVKGGIQTTMLITVEVDRGNDVGGDHDRDDAEVGWVKWGDRVPADCLIESLSRWLNPEV